jgi:hypothetical protein
MGKISRKKLIPTIAILFALAVAMIATAATVNATQWTVGVKAGDWAVYSFDGSKGTTIWNETVKIEVTSVVSTTIYYSLTWNPVPDINDPQLNSIFANTGCIDVQTEESSVSYIEYFIAVNGSGTTLGGVDYSISEQVRTPMHYLNQTFQPFSVTHVMGRGKGIQEDLYWIRSTGMLTELEISGNGFSLTMHITSASAIPEFTTPLLLLTLLVTTSATMILLRKKTRTRRGF